MEPDEVISVRSQLLKMMSVFRTTTNQTHEPPTKRMRLDDVQLSEMHRVEFPDMAELDTYWDLDTDLDGETNHPLEWWKSHEAMFPILSKCARHILIIPATSASAERGFSVSGRIARARSNFHSSNAAKVIFLNKNRIK